MTSRFRLVSFDLRDVQEGPETSFRVHPHPLSSASDRPFRRVRVRVYTDAGEGVRDLNFRRSNEVDYNAGGRKGGARRRREATATTRGSHLAEFHARVDNERRKGRKWNGEISILKSLDEAAKYISFPFSPPFLRSEISTRSFGISTVTSRLVSALRSMTLINILIEYVTRGVSFHFVSLIHSFDNLGGIKSVISLSVIFLY